MSKNAVLVCSNSGIDYLNYPKDIYILRSQIHFGSDQSYEDFTEMDAKTFYNKIDENPNDVPKTSYTSIGKMEEIFDELVKKGYKEALVITIAKPLSGLYDALVNFSRNLKKIKITVFDSKTVAYAEAFLALEAHRLFNLGYEMDEVVRILEKIRKNNKWYFAVNTLKYLVKNGRLTKLQGTIGTLLKIKPLLTIDENGKIETVEKIKTFNKVLNVLIEKYFEETKDKNVLTYISHAHNDEAVEYITRRVKELYPNRSVISSYLTPVVGAHAGPKAIGIGYLLLDEIK